MDRITSAGAGRYVELAPLGSGGMAEVYGGRDSVLDRRVVIKRLWPDMRDESLEQMFLDEARVVAALEHPNIVRIYDLGVDDGVPFMALEWLDGWDISAICTSLWARSSGLPLPTLSALMLDACRGLAAAHDARHNDGRPLNLVHRDISPQNLFVTTDGILKILDFGVAKSTLQRQRTEVGTIKGKLSYMAPEQISGGSVDRRADIFSLGIVLHELLSGRHLFSGLDPSALLRAITEEPIPQPLHVSESLPPALVRATMRALERDPVRRFATASELGEALAAAVPPASLDQVSAVLNELMVNPRAADLETATRPGTVAFGRVDLETPLVDDTVISENRRPARTATVPLGSLPVAPAGPPQARSSSARRVPWLLAMLALAMAAGAAAFWVDRFGGSPPPASTPQPQEAKVATPAPAPSTAPADPPRAHAVQSPVPSTKRPAASREPALALVSIDTTPWATVYLNGKEIGVTPILDKPVPAGRVVLRLVNRDERVDVTQTLSLRPGQVYKRRLDLSKHGKE